MEDMRTEALIVEVDLDAHPIQGRVRREANGSAGEFEGWMELTALLERLLAEARGRVLQ
jgi:hypothetical protein